MIILTCLTVKGNYCFSWVSSHVNLFVSWLYTWHVSRECLTVSIVFVCISCISIKIVCPVLGLIASEARSDGFSRIFVQFLSVFVVFHMWFHTFPGCLSHDSSGLWSFVQCRTAFSIFVSYYHQSSLFSTWSGAGLMIDSCASNNTPSPYLLSSGGVQLLAGKIVVCSGSIRLMSLCGVLVMILISLASVKPPCCSASAIKCFMSCMVSICI